MPYALAILKLEDYAKWEAGFKSDDSIAWRKESGQKSYQIFRTDDDPNKIALLIEWDNLDNARQHVQSEKLRKIHQDVGLIGEPEVYFLHEVEKGTV